MWRLSGRGDDMVLRACDGTRRPKVAWRRRRLRSPPVHVTLRCSSPNEKRPYIGRSLTALRQQTPPPPLIPVSDQREGGEECPGSAGPSLQLEGHGCLLPFPRPDLHPYIHRSGPSVSSNVNQPELKPLPFSVPFVPR
jgi:hypothetical protein